jgi:hypothetical protein
MTIVNKERLPPPNPIIWAQLFRSCVLCVFICIFELWPGDSQAKFYLSRTLASSRSHNRDNTEGRRCSHLASWSNSSSTHLFHTHFSTLSALPSLQPIHTYCAVVVQLIGMASSEDSGVIFLWMEHTRDIVFIITLIFTYWKRSGSYRTELCSVVFDAHSCHPI